MIDESHDHNTYNHEYDRCRHLLVAVLHSAVKDLTSMCSSERLEAFKWFCDDSMEPYSYKHACEILSLDSITLFQRICRKLGYTNIDEYKFSMIY